jgi:hypothetical protein
MIAKGTAHNNGAKLARYMTTGKDGERADPPETTIRGRKFQHLPQAPITHRRPDDRAGRAHVEHWTRQRENHWDFVEFDGLAQSIQLTSIGCTLPLTEVYDKIDFPA